MENRNFEDVKTILVYIFPAFEEYIDEDTEALDSLFQDFIYFYGKNEFQEKQLQHLAKFINEAVELQDDLENAISTCFLEHLRQIKGDEILRPLLTKQAKERLHA